MKKIILGLICIAGLASCRKNTSYYQFYSITYLPQSDQYFANAVFGKSPFTFSPSSVLGRRESVSFNGKAGNEYNDQYSWSGKGMKDGSFVLTLKDHQYTNHISAEGMGQWKLILPPQISKANGFTLYFTGRNTDNKMTVTIAAQADFLQRVVTGDSIVVSPEEIQNFNGGTLVIGVDELHEMPIQEQDEEMGGKLIYSVTVHGQSVEMVE